VEIPDDEVATINTSNADDSVTMAAVDDTDEGRDDVDADKEEVEEKYPESYFVPDDKDSIVIIEEVDDNILPKQQSQRAIMIKQ